MFVRTLMFCAASFAAGCVASPESPESSEDVAAAEAPMSIRTTKPNGCYISICKNDGTGAYNGMYSGNYICDVYKNCVCELNGHTAQCGYNATDCRQPCPKTDKSSKVEAVPVRPMPTAVLAP